MDWTTVFLHIPKTAGTSVRILFEHNCPRRRLLRVYPEHLPNWSITQAELASLPAAQLAGIEVVFGHFPFGIHRHLPRPGRYVTVLRDPVERVVSHYYHHVRRVAAGRAADVPIDRAVADGLTLASFARGEIPGFDTARAVPPSRNLMTRLLSDHYPRGSGGPDDPGLLEEAERNLAQHFLLVGLTENLPGFLKLLCRQLRWQEPGEISRALANPGRPAVDSLDPEIVQIIREHNRLDLALYEHAVEITAGGSQLAPGHGARRALWPRR